MCIISAIHKSQCTRLNVGQNYNPWHTVAYWCTRTVHTDGESGAYSLGKSKVESLDHFSMPSKSPDLKEIGVKDKNCS